MKEKVIIKSLEEFIQMSIDPKIRVMWIDVETEWNEDVNFKSIEDYEDVKRIIQKGDYYYYKEVATPMDFYDIVKLHFQGAMFKRRDDVISDSILSIHHKDELIFIADRYIDIEYILKAYDSYTLNGEDFLPLTK